MRSSVQQANIKVYPNHNPSLQLYQLSLGRANQHLQGTPIKGKYVRQLCAKNIIKWLFRIGTYLYY